MLRVYIYILIILPWAAISAYPACLSEQNVTEECLKLLYNTGEYELFVKFSEGVKFKDPDAKSALKIMTAYRMSLFNDADKELKKLSKPRKETLFFKFIELKIAFFLKNDKRTEKLIDEIRNNYPSFYAGRNLKCMLADLLLQSKKYDSAVKEYDECLKEKKNDAAEYGRLSALEKERGPDPSLIKDYLEFAETCTFPELKTQVLDRLVKLKTSKNFPDAKSAYFSRWLTIMRINKLLDQFYNDEQYAKLEYPSSLEVVRYLTEKERYADALRIIDAALGNETDKAIVFYFGWEKYRILSKKGSPGEAADFLEFLSANLQGAQKDKAYFYAALAYMEDRQNDRAMEIFENMVYGKKRSKFFLQALHKLGLIYMLQGREYYAFSLWGNFLFTTPINPGQFNSGRSMVETMRQMTLMLDQLNSTYLFTSGEFDDSCSDVEDETSDECRASDFISYYDFVYYHIANKEKLLSSKAVGTFGSGMKEVWKKNEKEKDSSLLPDIAKAMKTPPKNLVKNESVRMLQFFAENEIKDGLQFYVNYIETLGKYLATQDTVSVDEGKLSGNVRSVYDYLSSGVLKNLYIYLDKYAKVIDGSFKGIAPGLKFSPAHGNKDSWKILYPTPHLDAVLDLAVEFNVSPALIYGIMRAETSYRDWVVSPVGAVGLMQVMPQTFDKISQYGGIKISDPYNPYESMKASAWYLSKLLKRFDGNLILSIAAYNAGPHKASPWLKRYGKTSAMLFVELIPYEETRNYVKKVLRFYEIYSYLYEGRYYNLGLGDRIDIKENPAVIDF